MENNWHTKEVLEVLSLLLSNEEGLSQEEARRRLEKYGPNKLPEGKIDSIFLIFLRQFQSPLIYILFTAAIVVFSIGEVMDGSVILAVLFFNAIVGTIQEGKARDTLLALKKFTETFSTVLRDGKELVISDDEVVPGDIIMLREGEKVSVDARIISSNHLKADESSLTGESGSVSKTNIVLKKEQLLVSERKNMVFKGTHIMSGNGKALVVATGLSTEIGKIAQKIAVVDTEIPLKKNIRYLSRLIIIAVAIIGFSLFILGIENGKSINEMLTTVVALSVSIIPEGLPIVMTLVLATGVWRMSKCQVLVKRLQAVETLGQTKIIAIDKTGTLTRNEMIINKVYVDGTMFEIKGVGYEPRGEILLDGKIIEPLNHQELILSGRIASFCVDARISFFKETGNWKVIGDPTEAAILVFSEKIGFRQDIIDQESQKILDLPFNYHNKYHATVREVDKKNFLTAIGAPEKIMALCQKVWKKGRAEVLEKEKREEIESVFFKLARDGFRVVAFAINHDIGKKIDLVNNPPSLTFVGFFGIKDALRQEAEEMIKKVMSAGLKVVMITGDHRLTAESIAREAGIYHKNDLVLTGEEIDRIDDNLLADKIIRTTVFARVTPEHKLRIIKAYRKHGEIVAMTGDGVNDAPSLVAADLGVAMGKIGTEVAKEASDIVLLDDNLGNIVSAVEEGRNIYKTIKKVILYLFSTGFGEVFMIAGAIFLGYPLPILPVQIIWLNFVTDGFLDVALAMEPKEKGLLKEKFKKPKRWIVDSLMIQRIFLMALTMAMGSFYLFRDYFEKDPAKALTISLTVLAIFQWFNAWNCRSEEKSIFKINLFSNKFLVLATIIVVLLQISAVYNPFLQKVLHTVPLELSDWLRVAAVALLIVLVEEIRKFIYIKGSKNNKK